MSMLTRAERNERINRIRQLPAKVEAAVKPLNEEQLSTPYRKDGWTVRQVVHHLADSHMNAFIRMKLLLTEEKPTLKPYDQEKWAVLSDTAKTPLQSSLSILEGVHNRWSVLLDNLSEQSWTRSGFHPEVGEVTVEDLLSTYSHHGDNHLSQITNLIAEKGW
jgi:uncharacterized damage-inducible protein DinB